MNDTAIRVENLSKLYHIGKAQQRHDTLRDALVDRVSRLKVPRPGNRNVQPSNLDTDLWALKDVSFEVRRGEVVGIIGRNGAGKSTLLKILSRITEPTEGRAEIHGRVGSLLEVGTGFHPELTGRENIYLNGAILGMKRAEIERRFDEITAFADIEKFLDTPVKRYSSGMYVRLAFAVAAHLEPQILLVDEVLAVGDVMFQKKCLGKMGDAAKEGRTVLFVSHNMQAVSTLTRRSLLLSGGRCVHDGPTSEIIPSYLHQGCGDDLVYVAAASFDEPRVTRVELRTSLPSNTQISGQPMEVRFDIRTPVPIDGASISFQACNSMQQPILHLWTFDSERPMCGKPGIYALTCHIPKLHLYLGNYRLTVHFSEHAGGRKLQTIEGVCPFEVVMYGRNREFDWVPGTCNYVEECDWEIEEIDLA